MARLSAQAELGFIPTPIEVEDALLSYVAAPDGFAGAGIDEPAGKAIRGADVAEEHVINLNRRGDEAKFSLRR